MSMRRQPLAPPRHSNGFRRRPLAGPDSLEASVRGRIDHHAQGAMVVVAQRDEAERLQGPVRGRPHRREHFRHATHRSGLRLKGDFDKISLAERFRQAQQASRDGDSLEFSFGALAIFQQD